MNNLILEIQNLSPLLIFIFICVLFGFSISCLLIGGMARLSKISDRNTKINYMESNNKLPYIIVFLCIPIT